MDSTFGFEPGAASQRVVTGETVTIRPLQGLGDFGAAVDLQVAVWGERYSDVVPASLLKVVGEVGGLCLGAFAGANLVGFVFGLTGPRDDELSHWSHMLGVLPDWRDRGVGRALKEEQARVLRGRGVTSMLWTFDPLVARNAHLNLTRLGVSVVRYAPDMYGDTGSEVHSFGTDRLVVRWPLDADPEVPEPERALVEAPLLEPLDPASVSGPSARIEVPWDIEAINRDDPEAARSWRARTRASFSLAFSRAFEVVGFDRPTVPGACHYLLRRAGPER